MCAASGRRRWAGLSERYECAPFNVYIFPHEGPANEDRFVCEPGSLNFLTNHGFDFNKWIREGTWRALRCARSGLQLTDRWQGGGPSKGRVLQTPGVSYMSRAQEDAMRARLNDAGVRKEGPAIVLREDNRPFVASLLYVRLHAPPSLPMSFTPGRRSEGGNERNPWLPGRRWTNGRPTAPRHRWICPR